MADTLNGHRGGSIVTEDTILEPRSVGYIPANVVARASAAKRQVPAPNQGERVVFDNPQV